MPGDHLSYAVLKKELDEVRSEVPGFGPKPGKGKFSKKKRKKR
jgi:hypothetical protein